MKIKAFFLCLYLTIPFLGFGQVSQCISNPSGPIATSSKTKWIDVKRKVNASDTSIGCINSDLVPLSPNYRATIIYSGDQVEFFLVEPNLILENANIHWDIKKEAQTVPLDGCPEVYESYAKIGMRKTPPITFTKNSTESCNLYEKYLVELYQGIVLIDCMELFVIGPSDPDYSNNFDFIANSEQDDASPPRHRAVSYPEFSSEFINRSCDDGPEREQINLKNVFTTYNDNSVTRSGSPGTLKMTAPNSDNGSLTFCGSNLPWELNERSRNRRNDVNFYPKHLDGSDYYYQVSVNVPAANDPQFFSAFYNIIFEFHQSTGPIKELRPHCRAIMHLIIVGENKMRINYGLAGIGDCTSEDIPYSPGQWIDFTFRYKWKNVFTKVPPTPWSALGTDGLFECWYNTTKVKFTDPTQQYNITNGGTNVNGPNLDNYNPAYITFNQYRIRTDDSFQKVHFETSVLFDDFKIFKDRPLSLPQSREMQNEGETSNLHGSKTLVYPNPFSEKFFVENDNIVQVKVLSINDIFGNQIEFECRRISDKSYSIQIKNPQPNKLYVVKIKDKEEISFYKVLTK